MMRVARGRDAPGTTAKLGVVVVSADRSIVFRALVAGTLVLAFGLAGCGRKAALDPPPGAAVTTKTATPDKTSTSDKTETGPQKPNRPFFLDGLL